ncbi:pyridoxal phosphate-dependent aminotransferase [candidate division TA06 bacterium]|uniref:Aminotransferase n=1 Tax=candidate division TA06 bacterium TaxID=2250710 RepID=A0A660S602_UNCT6|nr:MAG: pyridoxal phosphate-dependent aminotransferase [candidate division TA06 bacterium]
MNIRSKISSKIESIKPSASITTAEKIKEMKKQGADIVDLSWGEPYFGTPNIIKESAKNAMDNNFTHYTNSRGLIELRESVSEKLQRENKIIYDPNTEILVTPGAKQAIFYAVYALVEDGDEVLIPEPYWLSYRDIVKLAGGKVVPIETKEENYFKPRYEDIESKISERTKAIIINSPNNPTGMVLDKNNLEDIAEIAKKHDLIVISDEIYEKIIFDGRRHYSIASFPEMKERTITINGFSKAFAMTGWRLGYLATSNELMEYIIKVHQHIATCANSFVQKAAISAFEKCAEEVIQMTQEYEKRRDIIFGGINSVNNLSCLKPEGTFYAFVNIKKLGMNSIEASEYLLEKAKIATVPGVEYGTSGEGYLRISFGLPEKDLIEVIERLQKALK